MSYIYSRVLVEAYLLGNCSDTDASVLLSEMLMLKPSCWHDKTTEPSPLSQFGMTLLPLTEPPGAGLLTWWLGDFLVKTSAPPVLERDSTESVPACGQSLRELSVRFDLESCSWRTVPCSSSEVLPWSSVTLPKWGLMLHGACWALTTPDSTTRGKDCGLLPTTLATDWKGGTTAARPDNGKLRFDQWRDYVKLMFGLTYPHPTHSELRMGWPERHTDLESLETGKYLKWLRLHSKY